MGLARLYEYEVTCDRCSTKSTFKDYIPDKQLSNLTTIDTGDMMYYVLANIFDNTLYKVLCYSCMVKKLSPENSCISINDLGSINASPVYYKSDIDNTEKYMWFITHFVVNYKTYLLFLNIKNSHILVTVDTEIYGDYQKFVDLGHVDTITELINRCDKDSISENTLKELW